MRSSSSSSHVMSINPHARTAAFYRRWADRRRRFQIGRMPPRPGKDNDEDGVPPGKEDGEGDVQSAYSGAGLDGLAALEESLPIQHRAPRRTTSAGQQQGAPAQCGTDEQDSACSLR